MGSSVTPAAIALFLLWVSVCGCVGALPPALRSRPLNRDPVAAALAGRVAAITQQLGHWPANPAIEDAIRPSDAQRAQKVVLQPSSTSTSPQPVVNPKKPKTPGPVRA
ncbi:hypothetical protein BMF94_3705 [Rhodotorula taiwanensis]|uniref:Uncharacterized protein n=1 Tax=Rhodotorula taiwanensis TaxID=741276 RepID=A0A2S5B9B8_9BASI|nr:hypothetical protein BMF94_3705 [Rhodotorula taiwanensis]